MFPSIQTYAIIALLIGWGGTTLFNSVTHRIELSDAVADTRRVTQTSERKDCDTRIASMKNQIDDAADASVAAGVEAAAGAPQITPLNKKAVCAASKFCRKAAE